LHVVDRHIEVFTIVRQFSKNNLTRIHTSYQVSTEGKNSQTQTTTGMTVARLCQRLDKDGMSIGGIQKQLTELQGTKTSVERCAAAVRSLQPHGIHSTTD
jgi:hypothetical protein